MKKIRYLPVVEDDGVEFTNGNAIVLGDKRSQKSLKKGDIMRSLRDQLDDVKALLEFIDSKTKKPEEKKEEPKAKTYSFAELLAWVWGLSLPVVLFELYVLNHVGEWLKAVSTH